MYNLYFNFPLPKTDSKRKQLSQRTEPAMNNMKIREEKEQKKNPLYRNISFQKKKKVFGGFNSRVWFTFKIGF